MKKFVCGLMIFSMLLSLMMPVKTADAQVAISDGSVSQSDAIKSQIMAAMKATWDSDVFGARCIVGTAKEDSTGIYYSIWRDMCIDSSRRLMRQREQIVEQEKTPEEGLVQKTEIWYDTARKYCFAYSPYIKKYTITPQDDGEEALEYLSLDFYLDYVPGGEYSQGDDTEIEINGVRTLCSLYTMSEDVEAPIFINGKVDGIDGVKESIMRHIAHEFYVGKEDGKLYINKAIITQNDDVYLREQDYYFPTENLAIPTEYTGNAQLADKAEIKKGVVKYLSFYSGKTTRLAAYDYAQKSAKTITIPASIKFYGKTYKVTEIDEKAFYGMKKLKKATVGKSVTLIGKKVFSNCPKLKILVIKNKKLKKKLKKSKTLRKYIGISEKVKIK